MTISLHELASSVIASCPPQVRLTAEDRQVIAAHQGFLAGLEDELVAAFYDTLYAHEPTSAVFEEGERPAREETLRGWWRRTVTGPLDDAYFAWMALVGVVHIRRGVRNPMMLSMFHVVTDAVHARARATLGDDEAERLRLAFSHLAATVSSVISDSYTETYIEALHDLAGLNPALSERMLHITVRDLEAQGRTQLA